MTSVVNELGAGGVVRHTPDSYRAAHPTCANTDNDRMADNIRENAILELPDACRLPATTREVVIVGGGTSVKDQLADIYWHRLAGHRIVAINGMGKYLTDHDLPPDDLLMLDARPHMDRFLDGVPKSTKMLLASIVHPGVVRHAVNRNHDVTVWHQGFDPIEFPELDGREYTVIRSVANAAGLQAILLMGLQGHRTVHLYGMDSCVFGDDKGHPYAQPENDGDEFVELSIGGQKYRGPLWMFWQANAFPGVCKQATKEWPDFAIHVHCPGLIRAIADEMIRNVQVAA